MDVKTIKCALFDMDGVLYDSMKNHAHAYHESLMPYGIDMPESMVYECEGMRGVDTMRLVATQQWGRECTEAEAEELYEAKCRIFRGMPRAELIPGVKHFIRTLREAGVTVCVVTGSGQISLLDTLVADFDGLLSHDLIICSKDYTKGKPAPDPYLMGLERCGATADEAIVVENAPLGVRAGRAAGIITLAVNTGPLPNAVLADAGATAVFNSMAEAEEWVMN